MVKMTHHIWVITTQKHTVTVDSSYNQFFLVVVTGPFLQCNYHDFEHLLLFSIKDLVVNF